MDEEDLLEERSGAYVTVDTTADSAQRMNRRMALEFRERLRSLSVSAPLSPSWVNNVEHIQYLASVAQLEEREATVKKLDKHQHPPQQQQSCKRSPECRPLGEAGSDALHSEESTLWEREEFCAKQIVEEGKTNLLMRNCAEFKAYVIERVSNGSPITGPQAANVLAYEIGIGVLLRITLAALEAMQTLDVRAYFDHLNATWDFVLSEHYNMPVSVITPKGKAGVIGSFDFLVLQEGIAFDILSHLFKFIDKMNEDVLFEKFLELELHKKMLLVAEKFSKTVSEIPQAKGYPLSVDAADQVRDFSHALCRCYAALFATETYVSKMNQFWPGGRPDKQRFVAFAGPLMKAYVAEDPEMKKELRPLSDALLRFG